eukprot:IDg6876t1
MEEAPTLPEQFSTIAETAEDAAHQQPQSEQAQKLHKTQVVEVKHEVKPPPSGRKAPQHKYNNTLAAICWFPAQPRWRKTNVNKNRHRTAQIGDYRWNIGKAEDVPDIPDHSSTEQKKWLHRSLTRKKDGRKD